ncbi:MAG: DUF3341 domain-containing protein [Hyphomicrobiales bacterium]|nr:MAG: DUF3341 domain-containing protein [Hyphomicrobiales bacterium]
MSASYGLLLQVSGPEELVAAARAAREKGIAALDAFSPFPVEDLPEALEIKPSRIPWIMLCCGIAGGVTAFATMSFSAVWHYPFIVGGRPFFSWPAFVPVTFELAILFSALGGAFALALLTRLPRLHHPVFNDRRFRDSAQRGFFLLLPEGPTSRTFLDAHYPNQWKEVRK